MPRYTLAPKHKEIITFKCVTCGKRDEPGNAYNLTVACCSEECFENALSMFLEANNFKFWGKEHVRKLVKENPVPLY